MAARAAPVPLDPVAAGALAGWVTGGLVLAAGLHRTGHGSMCRIIRTPPGWVGLVVFVLHLARAFGPYDPFHFASRHIPRRTQ